MFKAKEASSVDRIRLTQRNDKANKQCANCGELGPIYICTDFHTFVCTECSGVHRELSHKVKSISMSNWSEEEVQALESSGGNQRDHERYMCTYDPKAFAVPANTDRSRLREFVKAKYIEKRWIGSNALASSATSMSLVQSRSLSGNVNGDVQLSSSGSANVRQQPDSGSQDLFSFEQKPLCDDKNSSSSRKKPVNSVEDVQKLFDVLVGALNDLAEVDPNGARDLAMKFSTSLDRIRMSQIGPSVNTLNSSPISVHTSDFPVVPQLVRSPVAFSDPFKDLI